VLVLNELRKISANRKNKRKKAIYFVGNIGYYIFIINPEPMKRTNTKNIKIIRQILSTLSGDVRRKVVVEAVEAKGLIVNDTWPVIKPCAKGASHGHYSVNKMIALADAILNKGKTPAKTVAEVAEAGIDMVEAALGSLTEESSTSESSKGWRDGSAWGEIPYTDADVADELSLMGTYLD
tara:strand:- start:963 stop:1502 length:540 start_codon:yes stop_codon:yes gene_type:complete